MILENQVRELFQVRQQRMPDFEYKMEVSVYEIYMEQIFDLLASPLPTARSLPNKVKREKLSIMPSTFVCSFCV